MNIQQALFQRGHKVTRQGSLGNILVPICANTEIQAVFSKMLFLLMNDIKFRTSLKIWSNQQLHKRNENDTKHDSESVTNYTNLCFKFTDTIKQNELQNQIRFSKTFEWFVTELIKEYFAPKAAGFSLTLCDATGEDEFDCIAVLDEGLMFIECKTGQENPYKSFKNYIRRDIELSAKYSILLCDSESLLKHDANGVLDITQQEAFDFGFMRAEKIMKDSIEFYQVIGENQRVFFVCSARSNLTEVIRHVIRFTNQVQDQRSDKNTNYTITSLTFKPTIPNAPQDASDLQ